MALSETPTKSIITTKDLDAQTMFVASKKIEELRRKLKEGKKLDDSLRAETKTAIADYLGEDESVVTIGDEVILYFLGTEVISGGKVILKPITVEIASTVEAVIAAS